jgi:LPS sulfotransferase NodH
MPVRKLVHKLRKQAFASGILPGTKEYTRYIILARSRVGSNLLRGLLNAHSQVVAYGELFQFHDQISWAVSGRQRSDRVLRLFQQEPVTFLEQEVFNKHPKAIRAVGFKLFYYHAQNGNWKVVWEYLRQQPKLHVIHLKRANILKTHLSWTLANKTGAWVKHNNGVEPKPAVSLAYEECLEAFTETRRWESEFEAYFRNHPSLEVVYEDLAADYSEEMRRIQSFLGVSYQEVQPVTQRQARRPLEAAILNYSELKEQFIGTEWETFFEE